MRGISVEEAISLIRKRVNLRKRVMQVELNDAWGYISAGDLYAPVTNPSFARAAMDGYAVNSSDVSGAEKDRPAVLRVIGELYAGDVALISYERQTAVRIMTGAMMPEEYDAVVRQEDTDYGEQVVRVYSSVPGYANYCPAGENFKKGALLVPAGKRIDRACVGLLASAGIAELEVLRPLSVALIATGSELCRHGEKLPDGHIYSSISPMLRCTLAEGRINVISDVICPDDETAIAYHIRKALEKADIVITTGAVSVGKRDLMHGVLNKIGAEKLFFNVDIKPGSPTVCSVIGEKVILSLSGNPYAALVNFDLYFPQIVSRMYGTDEVLPIRTTAVLTQDYSRVNRSRRFVRAVETEGKVRLIAGSDQSSVTGNLSGCNCYIDVPAGRIYKAGERVDIIRIR